MNCVQSTGYIFPIKIEKLNSFCNLIRIFRSISKGNISFFALFKVFRHIILFDIG